MSEFTIEHRGPSAEPYIVGNVEAARAAVEAKSGPLVVTFSEFEDWWWADEAQGKLWGRGTTQDAALRYLLGRALEAN